MTLVLKSQIYFEKCGDILTGSHAGERLFELKCVFCSVGFECLPFFVEHINKQHLNRLIKAEKSDCSPANNFYDCSETLRGDTDFPKLENVLQEDSKNVSHENDPLNTLIVKLEKPENDLVKENFTESSGQDCSDNSALEDFETKSSLSDSPAIGLDQDREITLALITEYSELPVLWNTNDLNFEKAQQRKLAMKKLVNNLSIQFGIQFKNSDIERRLRNLRNRYKKDLCRQRRGDPFTPCWYFDKLEFLKDTMDLTQGDNISHGEKSKTQQKKLNDEQQMQMIEIYKSFPCLWDTKDIGYRFKSKRKAAMAEMLKCIEEKMQLKLEVVNLKSRLYKIRLMCTKEKLQKMKCERQGTIYKPKCKFYEKTKFLYEHVNPFKCLHCPKILKAYDQHQKHVSSHNDEQPFACTICQKGFNSVGNLNIHFRRHKQDFEFKCDNCGKGFASSTDLLTHSRTHTGEKPYCCEICGKSFAQESGFRRHKNIHAKRYSYKCELCKKGFYDKNALTEHMNIHLNIRHEICNVCGKAFTTKAYLRKHKETHNEKKYICKICSKSFAQYAGLFTHMKMH